LTFKSNAKILALNYKNMMISGTAHQQLVFYQTARFGKSNAMGKLDPEREQR
jgi:hypothetical protein